MAKNKDAPLIEQGYVYQKMKKGKETQAWVASMNSEGVILKDVDGEATHPVAIEDLISKWKLVGKHVSVGGVAKVVGLDNLISAAAIAPERTQEPSDPPVPAEQGVIHEAEEGQVVDAEFGPDDEGDDDEEPTEDAKQAAADAHASELEYFLSTVMLGRLRTIRTEYKSKELRLFCYCKQGTIIAAGDLKEMLSEVCEFINLHFKHLSPEPKSGELAMRGTLPPRSFKTTPIAAVPKLDQPKPATEGPPAAPVAPVNGDQQPAAVQP